MQNAGKSTETGKLSRLTVGEMSLQTLFDISSDSAAADMRISAPHAKPGETVIRGRLEDTRGPSGLRVHATNTVEAHSLTKDWMMQPAFAVAVVLEGQLTVTIDGRVMVLGGRDMPRGQFWNLTRPTRVCRQSRQGMHVRKVIVTVPRYWVERISEDCRQAGEKPPELLDQHCATGTWAPSRHVLSIVEQLINPGSEPRAVRIMSTESKAAEVVHEAFTSLIGSEMEEAAPSTLQGARARRVRRYVMDHPDRDVPLDEIRLALGMSVATMQKAFKATYRMTIGDFAREQRLLLARAVIEREGKSISEAAYMVGYDSPASFSTAFKRQFGFPPSDCKV